MQFQAIGRTVVLCDDGKFAVGGNAENAAVCDVDAVEVSLPVERRPLEKRTDRAAVKQIAHETAVAVGQQQLVGQSGPHAAFDQFRFRHHGVFILRGL